MQTEPKAQSQAIQQWSLIIFCYNEAGNLSKLIEKTLKVLDQISQLPYEIIIVDDGSNDPTVEIAQSYVDANPAIRLVQHAQNQGIGQALRTGYYHAQYENICAVPGDGQFDMEELLPFAQVPEDTIVSFYRKVNLQYSVYRNYLSLLNKKFNAYFLQIRMRDVNWVKVYKKSMLKPLELSLTSSLVESEICSKLLIQGAKLVETESKYMERSYGQSKGASLWITWLAMKDMGKLVWEIAKFKRRK